MADHERRVRELQRLQAENDKLEKVPNDLALALAKVGCLIPDRVDEILRLKKSGQTDEEIVAVESARLDQRAKAWDLDNHTLGWVTLSPFLNEFTRWIRKRAVSKTPTGHEIPTAAACYNPRTEEVEIVYNPRFMSSLSEPRNPHVGKADAGSGGVNEHEHLHLILNHVTSRRREPHALFNVAADCAMDSLIARCDTESRLSWMMLCPGLRNKGPVNPAWPKEVREAQEKFGDIIAKLPQEQSSEWYFQKIKQETEKQGYEWGKKGMRVKGTSGGEDGGDEWVLWSSDSHDAWDDIPEELRDIVEGKLKNALRRACEKADSSPNSWGNIPEDVREEIRALAFGRIDWKAVLRNWTGMRQSGGRSRSVRKIDRKYPYVHPGLKRNRNPSIVVMVDQSGSVDDEQLARIYGALDGCSKQITFTVVPFDHTVAEDAQFVWKRGTKPKLKRVRGGGTSFDAAVEWINSPKNRGRFEGAIICTDGECSEPPGSRVKLAWMITPGHKLMFTPKPGELVIQMDAKDKDGSKGKW